MANLKLKEFFGNSIYTVTRQGVSVILTLVIAGLLARFLGKDGYGAYNLAILLPLMLAKMTNLGIRQGLIYYIGRKDYPLDQVVFTSLVVMGGVSAGSLIIGASIIIWVRDILFSGLPVLYLWIALFALPFLLLIEFLQGVYMGRQDFKKYNFITIFPEIVLLVLLGVNTWIFHLDIAFTLVIYVISRGAILATATNHLKYFFQMKWDLNINFLRDGLSYSLRTHLGNISAILNLRLDQFLVNFFLGSAALGVYVAAVTLSEGLSLLSGGISTVLLPRVAELKDDPGLRKEITPLVTRHMVVISLLISLLLFFLSRWVVTIIYSKELIEAALILRLLLPGVFMTSFARILATDIAGRGYPELNVYGGIISIIITILVNLLLIPRFGLVGVAIASSIAYSANSIFKTVIYISLAEVSLKKVLFIQSSDLTLHRKYINNLVLGHTHSIAKK